MKRYILLLSIALGIVVLLYLGSTVVKQQRTDRALSEQTSERKAKVATIPCSGKPVSQQTEGPYYKQGSPARTILYEEGVIGEQLTVTGYVVDTSCNPTPNVWIDFWQADGSGEYDNEGYRLRGHQFTDQEGKYSLETVIPGEYPGRTPHIHIKLRATESSPIVTTQLYIPGSEKNEVDAIFDESLLMEFDDATNQGTYNFVLQIQ